MNDREAVETARNLVRIEEGHRAALQPSVAPQAEAPLGDPEAGEDPQDDTLPEATGHPPTGNRAHAADITTYNRQVALYNRAVALANQRDYKGAIAILGDLLKKVKDEGLREQINTFLVKLRRDAARYQKFRG